MTGLTRLLFSRRSWFAVVTCAIGVAFVVGSRPATAQRPQGAASADQRLSMMTAVDHYTSGPAYGPFDETQKSTLAPGMLADIGVLATDVFAHPPATRADIAVKATIVHGAVMFRAAPQR